MSGIDRRKVTSMIYNIYKNSGKWIGFSEGKSKETNPKACYECIKEGLKTFYVPEGVKVETVVQLEPEASGLKLRLLQSQKTLSLRL